MPRVIVIPDGRPDDPRMDELVKPEHLADDHSSAQFAERLVWAVEEAAHVPPPVTDYLQVPAG